jgi:Activator of Hsp90 ATPase homolog 1-like protein
MVRGQRLVQAWRAGSWEPGAFSIVRFELRTRAHGCRLIFDHRGFPDMQGASLAYGWRAHYWEPLAKLLQQG